jgi:hypothetical protein
MSTHAGRFLPLLLLVALSIAIPADAAKTYKMKSTVKEFVLTKWTLECPDGTTRDLTRINLDEEGYEELLDCINEIESDVGIEIESRTKVKDSVVVSDKIKSVSEMSEAQAKKLCDIIDQHEILSAPVVRSRPRIETTTVNGALDTMLIDCGDGRKLDLLSAGLDETLLQILLQWIADLEALVGTHIAGTTVVGGQDRVLAVTYLTAEQKEQLLQFLQSQDVAVPPEFTIHDTRLKAVFKADGQKVKVDLTGETVIRQQVPPPGQPAQIEIVSMELNGMSSMGPIQLQLGGQAPAMGQIGLPQGGRFRSDSFFDVELMVEIVDLGLQLVSPMPVRLQGRLSFPPKPKVSFKADGKVQMDVAGGGTATLKIKAFELAFPGHLDVFLDPELSRK